jgi:hypothetical protein
MADKEVSLGSGSAEGARKALASRGYQLHRKEAEATGDTPMTPEEWADQQKQEQSAADTAFKKNGRG